MAKKLLKAATRSSPLALWQTHYIGELLGVQLETVSVQTTGDQRRDVPIAEIRGRGVFVKEVQNAVLDGRADIAVHSAKDMMSEPTPGLTLACIPERGDPRDALIGKNIEDIPPGGTVATGSVRRRAQMADLRPDVTFFGLRGNVDTRFAKAAEYDSIIVAYAPIVRLQRNVPNVTVLEPSVMLPQVGQGALAVECRSDDEETLEMLAAIEHAKSRRAVDAERAFLAALGGGCDLPVACYAVIENDEVYLRALIASLDGHTILRSRGTGTDGVALGAETGRKLLVDAGGHEYLEQILGS